MRKLVLGLILAVPVAGTATAQSYPQRVITYITPSSPGGQADLGARTWTPYLAQCLGGDATVVVQTRPGAGGAIGHSELVHAAPDGYTIGTLMAPNVITVPISRGADWTMDRFEVLGTIVGGSSTINVRRDSPLTNLADLVEYAKASGTPINVGVGGLGGDDHLTALRFMTMADTSFNFIPFSDDATARAALLGGHVDVVMMSGSAAASFQEELRTIAVAAAEPIDALPGVATFREQGYDLVLGSTHIVGMPAGAPPEIVAKLRECLATIPQNAQFLTEAEERFLPLTPMSAEEASAFIADSDASFRALWETNPWIVE